METKVKYQYTYFIYTYLLKDIEYKEYISKLLNNKKYKLKIFEKEKDLEIYEYFKSEVKQEYFNTFYIDRKNYDKQKIINNNCIIFEYFLENNVQAKSEHNIFFKIPKIELICFNTGICFLAIKTFLSEDNINLSEILNFNYKMKDIYSEFSKLKSYENINLQTDSLSDIKKFDNLIKDITMQKLQNRRFFTYSYTCVDSENWNNEVDKLENDFLKYAYIYPSNYDLTFNEESEIIKLNNWKYSKMAFTKNSMVLLASNIENSNFTKIPYEYENKYFYTLILNLYRKELLENIDNIRVLKANDYNKLLNKIINQELTEDEIGEKINKKLGEALKVNEKLNEIKIKNKIQLKLIKRYRIMGKILLILLIISLLFNLLNLLNLLN